MWLDIDPKIARKCPEAKTCQLYLAVLDHGRRVTELPIDFHRAVQAPERLLGQDAVVGQTCDLQQTAVSLESYPP